MVFSDLNQAALRSGAFSAAVDCIILATTRKLCAKTAHDTWS